MNKNEEKLCKGCGKVKANTDYSKELETLREKVDWYWQCLDLANYFFDFLDEEDFDGDQPQHLYEIEVSCQIAEAELRSAVDGV